MLAVFMLFGLCACGGDSTESDSTQSAVGSTESDTAKSIAGRYEIYSMQFQDQIMNKEELTDREVDETVILKEDGTGTWIFSGDEVTISYDEKTITDTSSSFGETYNYEVKDDILTIVVGEDATYSYKLVS